VVTAPTPVPIVDQIQEKLERARTLVTNEEYDEATSLLKAVQGIDPANAEASALLSRIDDAKRIKAERAMAEKAMAEREQKVSEYLQQAKLAKDRRDWQAMRTAVREARKLDFQNALMRSDLDSLDADATEGERQVAEMERQKKAEEAAEARRQKELADMKDEEAAKQRAEREAAADAERKRIADQEKRKKSVTTRPQRKTEPDESDRPPRRPTVVREDTRPPASEKPVVKPRPATQAPPETKPQQRPVNVNRGTSIGG
jgi:translation initiation factor IF-2